MNVLQKGIAVRGLTKSYGDRVVVDRLDFDVAPGRITGFLGPNGAGKSTTLQMILGLTKPDRGTAEILGKPLAQHSNPARVAGALLGTERILPGLTARGHLEWIARAARVESRRVDELLEQVELTRAGSLRVSQLSLGMRQRLGIAAALLGDPEVLLLDEPLNGLDPEGIAWLRGFLTDFAEAGRTVLLSSHLLGEMALTAHHIVIIRAGSLVADLSLDELRRHSEARVRVRGTGLDTLIMRLTTEGKTTVVETGSRKDREQHVLVSDSQPREIYRMCVELGVELDELSLEEPDLEDIFMRLTNDRAMDSCEEVV